MITKIYIYLTITLFCSHCVCSSSNRKALNDDVPEIKSSQLSDFTGKKACLKGRRSLTIMQHPVGPPVTESGIRKVIRYFKPADSEFYELVVYLDPALRKNCPGAAMVCGNILKVTATKFGQEGSEYQVDADSWRCLD